MHDGSLADLATEVLEDVYGMPRSLGREMYLATIFGKLQLVTTIEDVSFRTNLLALNAAVEAARAVAAFKARAGDSWRTPIDRRTGRALLFQGPGLPLLPGAGNTLAPESMRPGVLDAHGAPTLEGIEGLARSFFAENRSVFLPDTGELVLNLDRSGILDDGRLIYADFDWQVDGVSVLGARSFLRVNNGNIVQAGTRLIGAMSTPTVPRLKGSDALAAVYAYASLSGERESAVDEGRLYLLPVADRAEAYTGPVGSGVYYRLVWQVAFREPGEAPTWTGCCVATWLWAHLRSEGSIPWD